MDVRFRPLVWTGPRTPVAKRRSHAVFKAGWSDTLAKLEDELAKLKATEIIIEADFGESDIRLDGWPRAGARPVFQGIKVSFNTPNMGRLEYATDTHDWWQANVRAIALSLEALRAVDRYGTTSGRQQYTGFKAIEARPLSSFTTRELAVEWIANLFSEPQQANVKQVLSHTNNHISAEQKTVLRNAMFKVHPDHGGSTEMMNLMAMAEKALGFKE
jgi:hypothetical protein